jgi:hypothetical protein
MTSALQFVENSYAPPPVVVTISDCSRVEYTPLPMPTVFSLTCTQVLRFLGFSSSTSKTCTTSSAESIDVYQ